MENGWGAVPIGAQRLNGAQLKWIAFLSMLIDHVNKAVIGNLLNGPGILSTISTLFDILGRIAFPIFAFLLVEGFFKTHSKKRYMLQLLAFGAVAEVPFDLFTTVELFNPLWNNVMFTLALCLAMLIIVDRLREMLKRPLWFLLSAVVVVATCAIAMALNLDYDYHAVLVTFLMYLFYERPVLGALAAYLPLLKEPWSALGLFLNLTYNGKRGRQNKWVNYLFYPVHLAVLGLIRWACGF